MGQFMFGSVGDGVRVSQAQRRVDVEFGVGFELMTDPAHPDSSNRADTRAGGQDPDGAVDEFGVDAVQQPAEHIACREDQDHTDYASDQNTDDRVGRRKSQRRANGAHNDSQ